MQLLQVQDEESWRAYHLIRRQVLYELRGKSGYDDMHPDEFRLGHFPLLFHQDGTPVGTVRLDPRKETTVGKVRLVAVLPQYQRQGLGTAMMNELENFAAAKGIRQLCVHAAPDAIAFYRKLGWLLTENTRLTKTIG